MNTTLQQDEDAGREWGILLLLCVNITADVYVYITPLSSCISTTESRCAELSRTYSIHPNSILDQGAS